MDYDSPFAKDNKEEQAPEEIVTGNIKYDPKNTVVPKEVQTWNWGAFMFSIPWGVGNSAYLTLLCLIPFFNIVWFFFCGFKGNEWAWKSGKFTSLNDFLATQKTWNRAGLVSFIILMIVIVLCIPIMIPLFSYGIRPYSQL